MDDTEPDFALLVALDEGQWEVSSLPQRVGSDLESFVATLRAQPAEGSVLGLAVYDDDFFLVLRPRGADVRMLLSDVAAATDWPIAEEVLEALELPLPGDDDEDEDDEPQPAGDLEIFADFGLRPMDVSALCADPDLYPDETLGTIASRLGFGPAFERAIDGANR